MPLVSVFLGFAAEEGTVGSGSGKNVVVLEGRNVEGVGVNEIEGDVSVSGASLVISSV